MLRKRLAALVALIALGVAACSGGSTLNQTPLPSATVAGPTISSSGTAVSASNVSGITSNVTVAGSGNVTASESSTPPQNIPVLSAIARKAASLKSTQATSNTALVYVTLLATSTTSITGFPASSFTFSTAPAGAVNLAYYSGTSWVTISTSPGTLSGTTITFAAIAPANPIGIPNGASLFLAVYQGGTLATPAPGVSPTPTPTPSSAPSTSAAPSASPSATVTTTPSPSASATATATPTPAPAISLNNSGFETTPAGVFGTTITSSGWTQCNINSVAGVPAYSGGINGTTGVAYAGATAPPISTFTPVPGSTPMATIVASGSTVVQPTPTTPPITPTQTQTTVPVHGGGFAAQFGGDYNNFNAADLSYNGLCQSVTVPAGGNSLKAWVFGNGNEASAFVENVVAAVGPTGAMTQLLYMENVTNTTSAGDTVYREIGPVTLPPGTYTLFIGQWTKSGATRFSGYWWVDDLH